jgi:type II secretory pathway component GspD/PulD (secretin)
MNISSLRWLCTVTCGCILALVQAPGLNSPAPASKPSAPRPAAVTWTPPPETVVRTSSTLTPVSLVLPAALPAASSVAMPAPQFPPVQMLTTMTQDGPIPRAIPVAQTSAPLPQFPGGPMLVNATTPPPAGAVPALLSGNPTISNLPEVSADGYWIENAPLNEIFQYLARRAEAQYFFNNDLAAPQYNVTGHLKLTDPIKQMDDLAIAYGLTVHRQGGTIYLMTDAQLAKLPVEIMSYPLKYLRGARPGTAVTQGGASGGGGGGGEGGGEDGGVAGGSGGGDFNKLLAIIRPILSPGSGHIEFEEKNNVLLVTDNAPKLAKIRNLLESIDRPKPQIVINVRILRVRNGHGSKIGVDWSRILGDDGLPIRASQSLNAMFGLPDSATLTKSLSTTKDLARNFSRATETVLENGLRTSTTTINDGFSRDEGSSEGSDRFEEFTDGVGLVFESLDMEAIVHALKNDDIVSQEACPTIITEDNEQGIISFVDRFPIVTTTVVATTSGTNITDEVRYKIDDEDPNAAESPEKSREIGVTMSVTPTLLPDGTVRMRLRPRVANIVELVEGPSGNTFPRVSESTIEGISRIPKGKSLFLGGFFDSNVDNRSTRVPILGSIPGINRLFSLKDKNSEQISLVFIITPHVYDASSTEAIPGVNQRVQWDSGFNRPDPLGPETPLLPEQTLENGMLPSPIKRGMVPTAEPTAEKKRSWFKWFPKRNPEAKAVADAKAVVYDAPAPNPTPALAQPPKPSRRKSSGS